MFLGLTMAAWLLGGVVCGAIAATIAAVKWRSEVGFFVLGFVLGPFAILAAAVVGKNVEAETRHLLRRGKLRPCPACIEPIRREASICPHCRTPVAPLKPVPGLAERLGRAASRQTGTGSRE